MRRFLALSLICLTAAACREEVAVPPEPIRPVKVVTIAAASQSSRLAMAGDVRARHEAPLAFRVGGKVIERNVELGANVRQGQVLGRIEAIDYKLGADAQAAGVARFRAELALAETDLNRFDGLRARGFVTEAELARQKTAVESARARLKAAEAAQTESNRQVGYTTLVADSAGVVTALDFNVGQVLAAGQPVLRLARPGEREVEIHIPEGELARVKLAHAFEVTLNARPNQSYPGTLRELAAAADSATRTYAARITVNAAQDALSLNMSATVRMIQNSTQTIRLPLSAVFTRDGVPRVWKLDTVTSTVRAAVVTTGAVNSNDWQIDSGLSLGEVVVVAGANLLHEGQKVRPLP